ncbi:hypothetical protein ACU686_15930 [Yinghuangia aomiensis]
MSPGSPALDRYPTVTHAASEVGTDVREALDLLDLAAVHDAARTVRELARPQADTLAGELQARYRTLNQPLRRLAKTMDLTGTDEAGPCWTPWRSCPSWNAPSPAPARPLPSGSCSPHCRSTTSAPPGARPPSSKPPDRPSAPMLTAQGVRCSRNP